MKQTRRLEFFPAVALALLLLSSAIVLAGRNAGQCRQSQLHGTGAAVSARMESELYPQLTAD